MGTGTTAVARIADAPPQIGPDGRAARGLLVSADQALVRAFRRELRDCADCTISFDVQPNIEEAGRAAPGPYDCVAVDLDGAVAPSEAVRLARQHWPDARVAVLSSWWSEREQVARQLADLVIHKPVRAQELRAFLRAPSVPAKASPTVPATKAAIAS